MSIRIGDTVQINDSSADCPTHQGRVTAVHIGGEGGDFEVTYHDGENYTFGLFFAEHVIEVQQC